MPIRSVPSGPGTAERVLLGLGNTVDFEIEWSDAVVTDLMRETGIGIGDARADLPISTAAELLRTLVAHLADGSGGEHFVASGAVLTAVASRFSTRVTLGGTNVRAALAMRALQRASTVHLVSTNDDTRRLLPPDVATISSAQADSVDPHLIIQFPADARIRLDDGELVTPRPNRVIFTNDQPNRDLVIAESFGDAVARADVVLVSGFNSMQERDLLDARIADVRRHLARRSADSVVVYEHGAFHVPAFSERVRERLGDAVDVWCCNEEELQAHVGRTVDLLDPSDVLAAASALHAAVGAPALVVHTRFWALAVGGDPARRRAMLFGGVAMAGVRYSHGDAATAGDLADAAGWPLQEAGTDFAARIEQLGGESVSCIAAYLVTTETPTTIGLGDAFAGGLVAALADAVEAERG